jgi:hypothetical protein
LQLIFNCCTAESGRKEYALVFAGQICRESPRENNFKFNGRSVSLMNWNVISAASVGFAVPREIAVSADTLKNMMERIEIMLVFGQNKVRTIVDQTTPLIMPTLVPRTLQATF